MNILLNDKQRERYKPEIETLCALCPEMMSRKLSRANVQQAFVLNMVLSFINGYSDVLCVGHFEDTAYEALRVYNHDRIAGIDPQVNVSLDMFFNHTDSKFDIIFSTSVIEHVEDDELFIEQICQLLKPNGIAILTCDFRNDYSGDGYKPAEDFRLYTEHDLTVRLNEVLKRNGCSMYGVVDYSGEPDFFYGVYNYSFATFTFKKD